MCGILPRLRRSAHLSTAWRAAHNVRRLGRRQGLALAHRSRRLRTTTAASLAKSGMNSCDFKVNTSIRGGRSRRPLVAWISMPSFLGSGGLPDHARLRLICISSRTALCCHVLAERGIPAMMMSNVQLRLHCAAWVGVHHWQVSQDVLEVGITRPQCHGPTRSSTARGRLKEATFFVSRLPRRGTN